MAASGSDHSTASASATHHKTLSESKFNSGDLISALNHARKALALSSDTEGVSSMVTAFETIITSASCDGDSPEWYKILKVEPFSDIYTIKEQYRKLALVLDPNKNPYVGCEEGFKLVNEAFKVLDDKVRRSEYDMKLRIRTQGEIVGGGGGCETSTFSTVCSGCGLVDKFDRKYLGESLMCSGCKESFEAKEEEGTGNGACSSKIVTYTRRKKRVGEDGERVHETSEEEAEGLNVPESLDEDDEAMMTLAEMQSVIKRKKLKVKITEKSSSREEQKISSGGETLMEVSTNKDKEALKKKKKKKKTNHKELSGIVDLENTPRVDKKRDHGKMNQEIYMEDKDFDFDKERMPRSFKKGQVWAVYDGGDEKMPRSYCLVSEVVSVIPFKIWISWLDFDSEKLISWVKISSSHIPCGRFRALDKVLIKQVKPFSHVVYCQRVARELYQIYPRKGSVWAVYSKTNSSLQRRKTSRYEIVVCLTMYSDAYGLSVAYLEKVNECNNLFMRRDYGYNSVKWVEKDDVAALLSHQIPAKKLPEDQSGAGLRESWVLDLASLPPDFVAAT